MKKIFTLAMVLVFGLGTGYAQDEEEIDTSLQFVDAEGTVVPDGSEITRTEVETDDFGDMQISSGLFVKNTTEDLVGTSINGNLIAKPSGTFQCCFPASCIPIENVGPFETSKGAIEADSILTLNTEWILEEGKYGTTTASFQLLVREAYLNKWNIPVVGDVIGYGPTVTVNFVYSDPTGINGTTNVKINRVVERYNAAGARIYAPVKGVNILKMEDGSVKKVLVK
ncbi:MAG: hypothetical protein ACOYJG_01690 [Prevotella sp.]|jgi:hypothetical protein